MWECSEKSVFTTTSEAFFLAKHLSAIYEKIKTRHLRKFILFRSLANSCANSTYEKLVTFRRDKTYHFSSFMRRGNSHQNLFKNVFIFHDNIIALPQLKTDQKKTFAFAFENLLESIVSKRKLISNAFHKTRIFVE